MPTEVHTPSANTAATKTISPGTGRSVKIHSVQWSYDGDPTGGNLLITAGGTTILSLDITVGGPGQVDFPNKGGGVGEDVVVTLAAGGASVTGKVNIDYDT